MTHYQLVSRNKFRSWVIITLFAMFVAAVVSAFAYLSHMDASVIPFIVLFSSVGAFVSYWQSDKIVIAMTGAKPAKRNEWFDFYTTAENVALAAQIPTPKLYVIEDSAMNAFATGRDPRNAAICATTGLLSRLNRAEVEAVVAHEMSHITSYDTRLMTIVSVMVGSVLVIADWFIRGKILFGRRDNQGSGNGILAIIGIVLILLSPVIAQLIQLAISRSREFAADAQAVAYTKNPQGMINALAALEQNGQPLKYASRGTAHLFIVSPLKEKGVAEKSSFWNSMFSTHPPITDRIAALQKLVG